MLYVGIDPGLDGALVAVDSGGQIIQQAVLPVISADRSCRTYDVSGMVAPLVSSVGGGQHHTDE
jgi:hypothetical protein